ITAMVQATIPLTRTTHIRPGIQTRMLFGDDIPLMERNAAGGISYGKYFSQQLPLPGLGHVEMFKNKFLSASLRLQQRLLGRHYLLVDGSVAEQNESLSDIFSDKPIWGAQIGYAYNSIAGPLGATVGWNSLAHRYYFLISLGFDF
ncbi:MAG: hypothetical protein IKX94_08000, partial [Muribaculaceae bacterium]|nr:hypothetical protein [Muribaculaceae bacterium]